MIGTNDNSQSVNVSKCRGGGSSYIYIGDFAFIFVSMIFVDSVLR